MTRCGYMQWRRVLHKFISEWRGSIKRCQFIIEKFFTNYITSVYRYHGSLIFLPSYLPAVFRDGGTSRSHRSIINNSWKMTTRTGIKSVLKFLAHSCALVLLIQFSNESRWEVKAEDRWAPSRSVPTLHTGIAMSTQPKQYVRMYRKYFVFQITISFRVLFI